MRLRMKKIENWLILPVMILFVWSLTVANYTLDFHLTDTYFVVDGAFMLRFLGGVLLLLFGVYKTIRHRHHNINRTFAVPHILITILLTGFLLIPVATEIKFVDYSNWKSYQSKLLWPAVVVIAYVLTLIIFLIYFIFQLLKKPIIRGQ